MDSKFHIPVCYNFGTGKNTGSATGGDLEDVLQKAAECGQSVKKNGRGYQYWMIDAPELDIDADKNDWIKKWNGHFNIDIDLKSLMLSMDIITITERSQTYFSKKRGGQVTCTKNVVAVQDAEAYLKIMRLCREIFDKCLTPYYKIGFITGSDCGFNYVCDGRPAEINIGNNFDWRDPVFYNNSFYFIFGNLLDNITKFAEECPDEEKAAMARLLLEHTDKTFDATSAQITRMKFCGTNYEHWAQNPASVYNTPAEAINKYGAKYADLYNSSTTSYKKYEIKNNKIEVKLTDNGDINWGNWENRMYFGYHLAYVYRDNKAAGAEFIASIKSKQLDEKSDRRDQIYNAFHSGKGKAPNTIGQRIYNKLVYNELYVQKEDTQNDFIYIDKYLSTEAGNIFAKLRRHRAVEIVAPTGYGKTHMVDSLAEFATSEGKSIIFLTPTRSIANSAACDMMNKTAFDMATRPYAWRRIEAGEEYDGMGDGRHYVCVYDTAKIKWLGHLDPQKHIIVIDEAHTLVSCSYRVKTMHGICDFLKSWKGQLMMLTATQSAETQFVEKIFYVRKKHPVKRNMQLVLYTTAPGGKKTDYMRGLIRNVIASAPADENCVVYYDYFNKKMVNEIMDKLGVKNGYCLYSSQTKKVEKEVRETGWYKGSRIMFVSAYGQYGINMRPPKKTNVYVFSNDACAAVQALSRVRNYDMLGNIAVYVEKTDNIFVCKPVFDYYSTYSRDMNKMSEIFRILRQYTLNTVSYQGRTVYADCGENGYSDAATAVMMKNMELGEFAKYANDNEIDISVIELQRPRESKIFSKTEKIKKKEYMVQMTEEYESEMLKTHTKRRVNCCKKVYDNYTGPYALEKRFSRLFESLPDECSYEELSGVCKSIAIAKKPNPGCLLAILCAHSKTVDKNMLNVIVWSWLQLYPTIAQAGAEMRDTILGNIGKIVKFAWKNRDMIKGAYEIQCLSACKGRGITSLLADSQRWVDNMSSEVGVRETDETSLMLLYSCTNIDTKKQKVDIDFEKMFNNMVVFTRLKEAALIEAGGNEAAANIILDGIEDAVNKMCEAAQEDTNAARAAGGAKGSAAGAKGGAAGAKGGAAGAKGGAAGAKSIAVIAIKIYAQERFEVKGKIFYPGASWGSKKEACIGICGKNTGGARKKICKLIKDGILIVENRGTAISLPR